MTDINGATPGPPQPQPVPTSVGLGQGRAPNGTQLVVVQVMTPTGMFVFFLDSAAARKLGGDMIGMAGGITVASPQLPRGLLSAGDGKG